MYSERICTLMKHTSYIISTTTLCLQSVQRKDSKEVKQRRKSRKRLLESTDNDGSSTIWDINLCFQLWNFLSLSLLINVSILKNKTVVFSRYNRFSCLIMIRIFFFWLSACAFTKIIAISIPESKNWYQLTTDTSVTDTFATIAYDTNEFTTNSYIAAKFDSNNQSSQVAATFEHDSLSEEETQQINLVCRTTASHFRYGCLFANSVIVLMGDFIFIA